MNISRSAVAVTTAVLVATGGALTAPGALAAPTSRPAATAQVPVHPTLTAVRVGRHATFDRVVFDFVGGVPGYRTEYVPVVIADARGNRVPVAGSAGLHVVFVFAQAHRDDGTTSCSPCALPSVGFPLLRQVAPAGDFEGYLSYGLGLARVAQYRTSTLTGPDRVVIDIDHAPAAQPRLLLQGSRGDDVAAWQGALDVVRDARLATDGIFGPLTAGATRAFQRAAGLVADGIVGPLTRAAMLNGRG